ncbi:MarR family transcriptional regulator [Candidatus Bipolaricaulota bacterium]|nr:MarR family transcriptional regulator [Candidatus Bipolaricaulota bacterium]TFH07377.1 MAG: MarR family transcriptional regulator [Candidatus Atribacteria bacterium]
MGTIRERAYRFLRAELESHGMQGLAPSHGAILSQLFRGDELAMSEIATRIDRDRSTVTTLIEKLAKHGYVEKRKDEKDGRIMFVRLTDRGRKLEGAFHEISNDVLARTYRGFSAEEKQELAAFLHRIAMNLEA